MNKTLYNRHLIIKLALKLEFAIKIEYFQDCIFIFLLYNCGFNDDFYKKPNRFYIYKDTFWFQKRFGSKSKISSFKDKEISSIIDSFYKQHFY